MLDKNDKDLDVPASLSNRVFSRAKNSQRQLEYEIILDHLGFYELNKEYDKYETSGDNHALINSWMLFSDTKSVIDNIRRITISYDRSHENKKKLRELYLELAKIGINGFRILNEDKDSD